MCKKRTYVVAVCMGIALASTAFASGNSNNNNSGGNPSANQDQDQSQGQGQAQGQAQGQGQLQLQGQVTAVDVSSRITNDVRNNATAFAGSTSNADSKSTSASGAVSSSGGNTQSVTVTDSGQMHYSGSYEVKNVPNVSTGNVYPSSPCMGGTSVGASGVGFGLSFGSSWTDDECGIRETARSFAGMDMKSDAVAVLCSSKYASVAPACKKE